MLSQRLMLMPMLTTDTTDMVSDLTDMDTDLMDMDTHTDTTERDPLMLSQRLRLMPLSSMELMDTHTLDMVLMVSAMLPMPHTPMLESTLPTLLLATLLPTPQPESPTPAMSESALTTSEPRFLARHSHRSETSSD